MFKRHLLNLDSFCSWGAPNLVWNKYVCMYILCLYIPYTFGCMLENGQHKETATQSNISGNKFIILACFGTQKPEILNQNSAMPVTTHWKCPPVAKCHTAQQHKSLESHKNSANGFPIFFQGKPPNVLLMSLSGHVFSELPSLCRASKHNILLT